MQLLTVLLDAADQTPESIIGSVKEYGLLVTLLVAAVAWLIRRDSKRDERVDDLQKRLEAYMAEDRKVMLDALNRNTEVMESIEQYIKTRLA